MSIIIKNALTFLVVSSIASVAMAAPGDAPYSQRLKAEAREANAQALQLGQEDVDSDFNKKIDIFVFEKISFRNYERQN